MHQCHTCGAYVTEDFARVFGSNHNEVYACPECQPYATLTIGAAATPPAETV